MLTCLSHLCQTTKEVKIHFNRYLGYKHVKHAASSGSEPRIAKIHNMVDRLFGETPQVTKPQHYITMNDRFHGDTNISDPAARRQQFDELQAELKANDAQVLKTHVRIGSYQGWKPINQTETKKPPKSTKLNKLSSTDISSPFNKMTSALPKEMPNLIWSESDMFKTTK